MNRAPLKCVSFMTPLSQFMTTTFQNTLPRYFSLESKESIFVHKFNEKFNNLIFGAKIQTIQTDLKSRIKNLPTVSVCIIIRQLIMVEKKQAKKKASLMIVLNWHFAVALLILAMRHTAIHSSSFEIIRGCEEINDSFYAYQMNTLKDWITFLTTSIVNAIAGVCSSSVERQECHQIDHCQLVNDLPDGQCTCQDISCRQGGEEENNQEEPVCGSDHVTYKNQCQLKNAACGKQLLNLTQIASVPCGKSSSCVTVGN